MGRTASVRERLDAEAGGTRQMSQGRRLQTNAPWTDTHGYHRAGTHPDPAVDGRPACVLLALIRLPYSNRWTKG